MCQVLLRDMKSAQQHSGGKVSVTLVEHGKDPMPSPIAVFWGKVAVTEETTELEVYVKRHFGGSQRITALYSQ